MRKVFLADGDALVAKASFLRAVLEALREAFPDLRRVSCYASPQSLQVRTVEEMAELRELGLSLHIASGDLPEPVAALAQRLGIDDWHAGLLPADKLALLKSWQAEGRRVMMLGDGINDSPVLAGADVSIAMGAGTALAQHSADCVLLAEELGAVAEAVRSARRTLGVVRQNLAWAVLYNLVALPLAAGGLLSPWMAALGMSASSLLVTGNALRLGRDRNRARAAADAGQAAACCRPERDPSTA